MSIVQFKAGSAVGSSSLTLTLDSTPTAGNTLVGLVFQYDNNEVPGWDTHTETVAESATTADSGGAGGAILYIEDISGGEVTDAHTFSVAAAGDWRGYLVEVDEVPASPAIQSRWMRTCRAGSRRWRSTTTT